MEGLETRLDSFDANERRTALEELDARLRCGEIQSPPPTDYVNMHAHTFFSFNCRGYSPSRFAWEARKQGLALAGIVDFDVLDGIDEFVEAGRLLGLRTCGGMETRVFVPEFADKVMTSPGEPGITYHMGVGIPTGKLDIAPAAFQGGLKQTAQQRNRELIDRVNVYLTPVQIDYDVDVLPLTPAANPTERHICLAYARKAASQLPDSQDLERFWSDKLGVDAASLDLPEGREFLNTLRSKTMKRGGAGYVEPDAGAFPKMADTNAFILAAGGIPTLTWLNGLSEGEQQIENLLDVAMSTGVEAINIIPDRNFTPGVQDEKLAQLQAIIETAQARDLPIVVGTEMNSPGQRFVDNFPSAELSPYVPLFLRGAYIIYAHSILQRQCGLGYTSEWARRHFPDRTGKNDFFEAVGRSVHPRREDELAAIPAGAKPGEVLAALD